MCTINDLKITYKISDEKVESKVSRKHLPYVAACFDGIELYVNVLELSSHEEATVRTSAATHGTHVAMNKCLEYWRTRKQSTATFRTLLDMLLRLEKQEVASKVCKYLAGRTS